MKRVVLEGGWEGISEKVLGNVWFRIERTESGPSFSWIEERVDGWGGWKFIEIVSRGIEV